MNNISTKVLIVYVVTVLTIAITGSALAALSLPDGTVTANRQDSSTGSYAWFGESVTTLTMDAQNVLGVTVSGKITGISNTDTSWVEIGLIPKAIWDYWQTAYSGNFKAAVYNKGLYVVHWSDDGLALSLQEGWDDRTSTTYTTDDGPFAWPLASPTTSDPWSFSIQMYPASSGDAYFAVAGADMYGEQPWTYGNTPSGATENDYSECYLIARIWSTTENATFSFVDTQAEILYTPTEVWVDDDYCALCPNDGHLWGYDAFDNIQDGIDAVEGSTVNVAAGTYTESILIEKELTLLGATAGVNKNGYTVPPNYAWDDTVESIIIHPDPSGGYSAIVDIHDVANVTFDGFVVQELNAEANKNSSLIRVYAHTREISNIHVVNNVIGPNTNTTAQDGAQGRMGLYIVNHPYDDKGVVNSTFAGNKIFDCKGNGDNVFLWTSYYAYGAPGPASMAGTVIEDNEICGAHRSGIETAGGFSDLTIRNNVIYGNSGLPTDDPNFLKYGHGIQLIRGSSDKVSDPLTAYGPVNLTIEGNEIYGNEKNGIYMGPKNESITFTGNNIHDNGWDGIMLDLEGNYWNPTFEDPPISYQYACYDCSNNVVASNNAIYDNATAGNPIANYGVQVKGVPTNGFIFDAKLNYWGAASGPYDPGGVNETNGTVCYSVDTIKNADGAGNGVSDNHVEYCPWLDTAFPDSDFDGVLDGVDNCNDTPNGPFFGTCISGDVGGNCVAHSHCGPGGVCSMDQEDNDLDGMGDVCDNDIDGDGFSNDNDICPTDYDPGQEDTCPSGGNGCGDACECEGDFDMDRDVDGTDAMAFKTDFFRKDCSSTTLCNGDFSCDGDVDGSDAVLFKADFFRKDCPDCGGWPCVYE